MKKLLVVLVAILGFAISANAQMDSKSIANSNGTVSVSVTGPVDDQGYVGISFSNDEPKMGVTVTYNVQYMVPDPKTGIDLSKNIRDIKVLTPNLNTSFNIRVGKGAKITAVTIEDARCYR